MSRKKLNKAIREYMKNQVYVFGQIPSKTLVDNTKRAFPTASSNQVAGNLSAACCYFNDLNYNSGMVS